jgi:RNA polymerase sigma factor (sigma-70 family)
MPERDSTRADAQSRQGWFVTTHWSVVLATGRDSAPGRLALERLCQTYWYPLYLYVRRLGHRPHDAEDLVQSFFAQCLAKNYLQAADRQKGRFRSFLLIALKRFLANEWDKVRTQKRGGTVSTISLDGLRAEDRYALEPAKVSDPSRLFDRRWALTLLENVLERLRDEQTIAGRGEAFGVLKDCLGGGGTAPYDELATRLNCSVGAVKVSVHRLRRRYRELLEAEIANTVASPDEIEKERRYLLEVLRDGD